MNLYTPERTPIARFQIYTIRSPYVTLLWMVEVFSEEAALFWLKNPDYQHKKDDILFLENEIGVKSKFSIVKNDGVEIIGDISPVPELLNYHNGQESYGCAWNCAYESITARDVVDIFMAKNESDPRYATLSIMIVESMIKIMPDKSLVKNSISLLMSALGGRECFRILSSMGADVVMGKVKKLIEFFGYDGVYTMNNTIKKIISVEWLMKNA